MKEITLTRGKVALVDDADCEWLSQWKWRSRLANKRYWYAATGRTTLMHRVILGLVGRQVCDHIDGDTLNNQRYNLRESSYAGNAQNRNKQSKTIFKGVHFNKRQGRFAVRVRVNGMKRHVGYFDDPVDAAKAYDRAALESYGEFARTNQMLGLI
jgi:hypothetical protein